MRKNTCLIALGVIILGCFTFLVTAKKYELDIQGFMCLEQNESGGDEMQISISEDGRPKYFKEWKTVYKGNYLANPLRCSFDHTLKISFVELDLGFWDNHDKIGEFVIDSYQKLKNEHVIVSGDDAEYKVFWTDLTSKSNEYQKYKEDNVNRAPSKSQAESHLDPSEEGKAKQVFKELDSYLAKDNRMQQTSNAAKQAYNVFTSSDSPEERNKSIDNLKNALGFHLNPFRGIIENINKKEWPTLIIYGPTPSFNLFALSANAVYGIAIQLDGDDAAVIFELDGSLGLTAGHEGRIGFGINRNSLPGVAGWTWGFSIPADAEIVGGITFSYDLELFSWNLQEITYTWGPLPASLDVGLAHTWVV